MLFGSGWRCLGAGCLSFEGRAGGNCLGAGGIVWGLWELLRVEGVIWGQGASHLWVVGVIFGGGGAICEQGAGTLFHVVVVAGSRALSLWAFWCCGIVVVVVIVVVEGIGIGRRITVVVVVMVEAVVMVVTCHI